MREGAWLEGVCLYIVKLVFSICLLFCREGYEELFSMLDHHNIPITIFSAGLHGELTCDDIAGWIFGFGGNIKGHSYVPKEKNVAK